MMAPLIKTPPLASGPSRSTKIMSKMLEEV